MAKSVFLWIDQGQVGSQENYATSMQTFYFVCLVWTNGSMDQWTHAPMGADHQAGSIPHICNFWYATMFLGL